MGIEFKSHGHWIPVPWALDSRPMGIGFPTDGHWSHNGIGRGASRGLPALPPPSRGMAAAGRGLNRPTAALYPARGAFSNAQTLDTFTKPPRANGRNMV